MTVRILYCLSRLQPNFPGCRPTVLERPAGQGYDHHVSGTSGEICESL